MRPGTPEVISDNRTLRSRYAALRAGDVVVGRVSLRASEEHLLLDLVTRGVELIPSALSQLASRSKALQARIFEPWLPPHTRAVHDDHQLQEALTDFPAVNQGVVTKLDRKNAGMGVHLWPSLEEVYSQATLGNLPYPFVLQPFFPAAGDIRVIVIADFVEAYRRHNPANFRNNLHCGGRSTPCTLKPAQLQLCREVMARGGFPYAHLDLLVTESGETYLTEINLRGGIHGARIGAAEYGRRIQAVHERMLTERTDPAR